MKQEKTTKILYHFDQKSNIPNDAEGILKKIKENGGEAYLVGGCVRDAILMRQHNDIDIATNFKLDRLLQLFPGAIQIGKKVSIVQFKGIDISTFRIDGKYSDGKYPDEVMFVNDVVQDLSRRDFTINAIAFDGERFVDPFNGMDAIRRGIVQTVNSPRNRFDEDPLRMLRAFRFSSVLGYNIANSTYKAIRDKKALIREVAPERIRTEILRLMCGENLLGALFSMSASGLLFEIFPDLRQCKGFKQNKYHRYDVLEHSFRVASEVPSRLPLLRVAALMHDLGKTVTCQNYGTPDASFHKHEFVGADMTDSILNDLTFSKEERKYVSKLIQCHMFAYREEMKDNAIRRFLRHLGPDLLPDLMLLKYADRVGGGKKEVADFTWDTRLKKRVDLIEKENHALKISDLKIKGKDLISIGVESGPFMGKMLKMCLDYVLDHPTKNKPDALREFVLAQLEHYNGDEVGVLQEETV